MFRPYTQQPFQNPYATAQVAAGRLADTEYSHVTMPHDRVAKIVKETEATNPDVPPAMRQKWDAGHKAVIEKMAEAETYLGMYK